MTIVQTDHKKQSGEATAEEAVLHKVRDRHGVAVLLEDPDEIVREQVGGFVQFIRERAVVGVAIGFIVGLQAQTLIKQLVDSFITPFLALLLGRDLQSRRFAVGSSGPDQVQFQWGAFVYALVDFMVVLLFIYLIVKIFKLDRLDKK
ncbi:MAG TPA: MscL family protein [Candidatus Saccharimonadales bacterium]|jgi:large-conductance mechanosensitive channel